MIRIERVGTGFRASVSPPEGEPWTSSVVPTISEAMAALAGIGLSQWQVLEGLDASTPGWRAAHEAEVPASRQVGRSRRGRPDYVRSVQDGVVVVDRGWWRTRHRVVGDEELAILLGRLRDRGLPFLDGPAGWPPAAVFTYLCERELLAGGCDTIVFEGEGRWVVRRSTSEQP